MSDTAIRAEGLSRRFTIRAAEHDVFASGPDRSVRERLGVRFTRRRAGTSAGVSEEVRGPYAHAASR
jgi:hypothetical protein